MRGRCRLPSPQACPGGQKSPRRVTPGGGPTDEDAQTPSRRRRGRPRPGPRAGSVHGPRGGHGGGGTPPGGGGGGGCPPPATGETRHVRLGDRAAPHGVIVGPDGAPWVTDGGLNALVRVDPATAEVRPFPLPPD